MGIAFSGNCENFCEISLTPLASSECELDWDRFKMVSGQQRQHLHQAAGPAPQVRGGEPE